MKICFISGCIARAGGTERVGSIIANALCDLKYDIYVLSFWNQGNPHYYLNPNIHVHYLLNPRQEGKLYRTYVYPILKLHYFLQNNMIDIVIDIDTELAIYTAYAVQFTKCKWISWEHFNYWTMLKLKEKKRFRAKKLIKKYADGLIVLTEEDRLKHIKQYNLPEDFVTTIYNPCPSNVKFKYSYDTHTFLSVGRLASQKGYDLLLDAWRIVEKTVPDWKLVIVGKGELEKELLKKKELLQLKNIEFVGHTNHIEEYYSVASCYILSSRYEGFPMVILEAQSYGLPTISFDCKTGPKDLINGTNGILVENGNIEKLAKAMILFTKDKLKAINMSEEAMKSVQRFDLPIIIGCWEKVLNKIYKK